VRGLLTLSNVIDAILAKIASIFGWAFLALVIVICFDVITRKFGFQLELFGIPPGRRAAIVLVARAGTRAFTGARDT
jgi:hypothetical protein